MAETTFTFKKGDRLRCVRSEGYRNLTLDKIYTAANDQEDGIYGTHDFITFIDDFGEISASHATRFELVA